MSVAVKIASWVEKKPLILIRFDEAYSESLFNVRQGFEHLTIVKPHSVFHNFKLPTLCVLEINDHNETGCYLAVATRKTAVSTFDSRLTINKLRPIKPSSIQGIEKKVTNAQMKRLLSSKKPPKVNSNRLLRISNDKDPQCTFSLLSPKLSVHLIELLAQESDNNSALNVALSLLPNLRHAPNMNWAQEDAIHTALAAFGIRSNEIPNEVVLKRGASSGLELVGAHLYEDNVVHADASHLPGFEAIAPDITGRAIFEKRDERLIIYTANKLPLEEMLGVDLIYINETRGNIIMIQYKMLEEGKNKGEGSDWLFRPNSQLRKEIARMQLPFFQGAITDYRLNPNPFFFKFIKRKIVDDSHQSFLVSLDHLKKILASPEAKGLKNGIRLSYNALDGTYLREADMIGLIRSGYVGTHRTETEALAMILSEVSKGGKAIVLAWQRKIQESFNDNTE